MSSSSSTPKMFTPDRGTQFHKLKSLSTAEEGYGLTILSEVKKQSSSPTLVKIFKAYEKKPEEAISFVYRLSEIQPSLLNFFENNAELNAQWVKYLAHFKNPILKIEPIDQSNFTLYSRLKAAFLFSQFQKSHDPSMLEEVCKLGLYQGLVTRLTTLNEVISGVNKALQNLGDNKEQPVDSSKLIVAKSVYRTALVDATSLGNLYWSVGFINATNALTNLAKYFFLFPLEAIKNERFQISYQNANWSDKDYDVAELPDYVRLLQVAIESFYKAKLLEDFPMSKQITDAIYPQKGLLTGFEEHFKDWNGAEKYFLNFVTEMKIPNPSLFCARAKAKAEAEVESIKEKHTPKAAVAKK